MVAAKETEEVVVGCLCCDQQIVSMLIGWEEEGTIFWLSANMCVTSKKQNYYGANNSMCMFDLVC